MTTQTLKHIACLSAALLILCTTPTMAKKSSAKPRGGKITGVYCAQGPDSVFIGASQLKPSQRNRMYVGQKAKINIAGFGPVDCVVR